MEINLLKYFTVKRFINVLKIIASFNISRLIGNPVVWGMPLSYSVEPTNHCNLKCPECPSGSGSLTRSLGLMRTDFYEDLVDEISPTGFYIQLFFQGEPYIHKDLPQMINYARQKKMYVSVSTNGQFINKNNIDKILDSAPDKLIYSLDGLDEKTYQNYRIGGTFAKADEGLRNLIERKMERKLKKPFIELQFIVMKQNEHLLEKVIEYGKEIGVNQIVFKTMQISSYQNAIHFLPDNEKFRRYEIGNGFYKVKGELKNHCFALWRTSVITWDGNIVPCCFDKDAHFIFGRLNGRSFNHIWQSEEFRVFRKKVLSDRKGVTMCSNCTEGMSMNILELEQ
jgi:radical SAM protein with 4Fe4S-binding SPASM domain